MPIGLFLNPVRRGKAKRKPARRRLPKRRTEGPGRWMRAFKPTRWQRLVKKHGGDMKAAKREYSGGTKRKPKARKVRKASTPKRRVRRNVAGLVSRAEEILGRRRPMARRKTKRRATRRKARRRTNPYVKRHRRKSSTVKAHGRRRSAVKSHRRKSYQVKRHWRKPKRRRKAVVARRRPARKARRMPARGPKGRFLPVARNPMMGLANPWGRRVRRRGVRRFGRRRGRRRRNPIALAPIKGSLKVLFSKPALRNYALVTGGFVAGGVLPGLVTRGLSRIGVDVPVGATVDAALGVGTSIVAGVVVAAVTKSRNDGILVTAGGIAGVLGKLIITKLDELLPMSGLGDVATARLRETVEEELRRAGLGQFVTPEEIQAAEEVSGLAQFVVPEDFEEATEVSGFGQDIDEGAEAFDGF